MEGRKGEMERKREKKEGQKRNMEGWKKGKREERKNS